MLLRSAVLGAAAGCVLASSALATPGKISLRRCFGERRCQRRQGHDRIAGAGGADDGFAVVVATM